jgi:hypothetical protein
MHRNAGVELSFSVACWSSLRSPASPLEVAATSELCNATKPAHGSFAGNATAQQNAQNAQNADGRDGNPGSSKKQKKRHDGLAQEKKEV